MIADCPAKENFESYYLVEDIEQLTEWLELESILAILPIGISSDNIFIPNSEYKTKVFTGNHEIILGGLEDRYGRDNLLQVLRYFIPEVLSDLNNSPFSLYLNQNKDFIGQMYLADIVAIVTSVRIEGQHWGVPIACTCPCDRAIKIQPKSESDYHNLKGLKFRVWRGEREPRFKYKLKRSVGELTHIILSPPKFAHVFDPGFRKSELAQESKEVILLSNIDEITYEKLSASDRTCLKEQAAEVATIGMEHNIEMFCPECDLIWDSPLILGINHPDFILSLLTAPRGEDGDTRDYIFELVKFLTFGEQAPFKSASEILELTPKTRNNMVQALSESYKEQARKMKSK